MFILNGVRTREPIKSQNLVRLSQGEMMSISREANSKPRSWQLEPRLIHLKFISRASEVELASARRVPTRNSTCPRHRSSSQAVTKFKRRDDAPKVEGDKEVSPPRLTQTPSEKGGTPVELGEDEGHRLLFSLPPRPTTQT